MALAGGVVSGIFTLTCQRPGKDGFKPEKVTFSGGTSAMLTMTRGLSGVE